MSMHSKLDYSILNSEQKQYARMASVSEYVVFTKQWKIYPNYQTFFDYAHLWFSNLANNSSEDTKAFRVNEKVKQKFKRNVWLCKTLNIKYFCLILTIVMSSIMWPWQDVKQTW